MMIKSSISALLYLCVTFSMMANASEEALLEPLVQDQPVFNVIENSQVNAQDVFNKGYALFKENQWQEASDQFLRFIELTDEDEKNFEWAEFFMGISLDKLGFTHAAMDRLSNLAARKPNTRIVSYILEMFEQVSRRQPFDFDQIILQVVNDKDYGFINEEISGFVHFYQGMQDWKTQHIEWAKDHFSKIPKESYYHRRVLHYLALNKLHNGQEGRAVKELNALLLLDNLDEKLADDTRWTLARIYYQLKEWSLASLMYKQIKTPVIEQASFLLEQSWIAYQKKDYERAMGYLYAFEAPSFKQFFTPEYFILKSFIYKDVCHFESALSISDEFVQRYEGSLQAIYDRKHAADIESEELLYVILAQQDVKFQWDFIQALELERQQLDDIDFKDLKLHLEELYSLKIAKTSFVLADLIDKEYEVRANALLEFEEASNLMRYEIGVDMYQSQAKLTYQNHKDTTGGITGKQPEVVKYNFQKEYWNDELGHYKVTLPNKCLEFSQWELFFK